MSLMSRLLFHQGQKTICSVNNVCAGFDRSIINAIWNIDCNVINYINYITINVKQIKNTPFFFVLILNTANEAHGPASGQKYPENNSFSQSI